MKRPGVLVIFISGLLAACFSPWAGDETTLVINVGGGAETGRAIAIEIWPPDPALLNQIEYVVTLKGADGASSFTQKGGATITSAVIPGIYDIDISAAVHGERYAKGFCAAVDIKAGKSNVVQMAMSKWLYAIGDTGPGGGKIFYFDPAGIPMADGGRPCHYFEAAPTDAGLACLWTTNTTYADNWIGGGPQDYSVESITSTAIGDGRKNTQLIYDVSTTDFPVVNACRSYESGGKTDWFLPSGDELIELSTQREQLGLTFTAPSYWSSSETSWASAHTVCLTPTGSAGSAGKGGAPYNVRPIRAF